MYKSFIKIFMIELIRYGFVKSNNSDFYNVELKYLWYFIKWCFVILFKF